MTENLYRAHAERVRNVLADGSAAARSMLAASWKRSWSWYGLSPEDRAAPPHLSGSELAEARERVAPIVAAAQQSLDRLFLALGATGCCVLLTDRQGVPVDRRGADADDETFRRWGLWTGAVWSEEAAGTNGIGTCLAEQRALTIHRDQHFHTRNIALSCTVAPIYDPQGCLVGALDVSSCRADLTEGFIGLISTVVADAARQIEVECFQHAFQGARLMVVEGSTRGGGLIAIDRDDLVIGATHDARRSYGLTDERLSSGVHVGVLLYPDASLDDALNYIERSGVNQALSRTAGNVSAAAKALGVSRATLHRKLARLGLKPRR